MKPNTDGILNTFKSKAADELTRLREENETLLLERDRLRLQLEAAQDIEARIVEGPHGWIQWKGTNVCIDLHCTCGNLGHFDGDFAYAIKCAYCGAIWKLGQNVQFTPLPEEEMEETCIQEGKK